MSKKKELKVFYCTDHDAHYVGGVSLVKAKDRHEGKRLLDAQLKEAGLKTFREKKYTLVEVPREEAWAIILHDGDY